ncbi:phage tail protein [Salmonella enterica]|uniref:phage tail-collar fiber domain-containing protein n=1 Tax=Salmonella enterica TaxID=28901 RepID=UPI0003BCCF06|nr:phage tail protein [Salmonella enterica]EBU8786901.1 phage tail protein [Salmonella enterica subsp. enterica serovar Newport]EDE7525624.1 phage tail protein [Salmonella enterica subsp. enterica serovar Muenchen]EDX1469321.1 phage tail protein [Salmonella enterica subsp. enterica serovar Bovismorbificans]EGI5826081.1 phage tail protein [Salmonella enterica subsp. enterica serovar Urbana]EIA7726594.1 phage tail protein [Salmonella enterica subsp. enterica serovar Inverness]EKS4523635.1 phage
MSQAVITKVFSEWKAQQAINNQPVTLDEFIFAYIPGLVADKPIDNTETTPAADKIVYRQAVSKSGVVNENSVVYSVTLGADVGDFDFNWIGLANKATGTLAMIIHAPTQRKIKNANGQQGNVLVRSMLMEYSGAREATEITTPAETWQIDFTARLAAMDERQRLENIDIFGAAAFFGDGYLVGKSGNQFYVTKGTGYVAGLRTTLAENLNITVTTRPVKVWLDVCWTGTLTSVWGVQSRITVADNLADYVQNGLQHYVFAVAGIDENGNITDLRPKGTLNEQQASDALRKHEQSRNHPDATTREKGFVQLSSDTNSESESLAATPKAVKAAMDNANGRVPSGRKVNGHPLSGDITLWASDVKAISADAIGQITDNGTMASANTPGWWRVAVSNSDTVADFPTYPDGSKLYSYGYMFVEKIGEVWFQHYYAHMGANAKRQDWGTEPNTSRQWVIDYNTVNKPSASDVGALPITGGRLNGPLGIGTDNALGGNSIVFGDNDTGFKWHSDGVLGIYANSAQVGYIDNSGLHMLADIRATGVVRTGNGKTLTLSSGNNSALNAGLSLWGGGERPTVIELSDEQGWHLYSQRNTDGSISFTVNGIVYCNALNIGGAIYQNNGDIFGSLWGNGWLSTWIHNNVVKAVRLGPVALSGGLWRDFQLGGGQVVTGFHTDGSWEMEGNDDKVYYRPIQYLVGDTWVTAPSV